jgi:hypothetical protein
MERAFLCAVLLLRTAGAGTIQGTVVEHLSGRPLARALVTLTAVGPQGAGGAVATRANTTGQFRFVNLAAGAYLLSAARTGFATMQYGQKNWKSAGAPIFLPEPESNFTAELRLHHLGAITGAVWDENQVGLPGQDVVVYEDTRPLRMLDRVKTDDRGIFRFGELRPGRYLVRTRGTMLDENGGPLPTFHRDSAGPDGAVPVSVELDEQTGDVNIQPSFGKLYRLTGAALLPPRSQANVALISDMGPVPGSVDNNGHFTFEQLPPGNYELTGEAVNSRGDKVGGYRKIVMDRDMDVSLEMSRQPEIYVECEEQHGKQVESKSVAVSMRRKLLSGADPARRIRPQVDPLPPGPWEISVTPIPEMYVVSITARDYSVSPPTNGWKEVFLPGGRDLDVKVLLSAAVATLYGKVTSSGKGAAGVPVFLEPFDLESGAGLTTVRTARTDLQGRYHFTGLAPGRYRVLSSFDFNQPTSEEMEAARAVTVALKEGTETSQDLELFVGP